MLIAIFGSTKILANDFPAISYLGIEQGLSNNAVTSIYQDHNGFIWVGTIDGLNRYDGYQFKIFRNQLNDSNSLVFNRVTFIEEDPSFNLWIGTTQGVSIFNQVASGFSSAHYVPFGEKQSRKITSGIHEIKSDKYGNVFIATVNTGLLVYKKGSESALQIPYAGKINYDPTSIAFDSEQRVWLYIRGQGLCQYDYKTNTIRIINSSIKNGNCLKIDNEGHLFLGTDNGVFQYTISTNIFSPVFHSANRIVRLSIMANRDLWIASDGGGIFIMNPVTRKVAPFQGIAGETRLTSSAVFDIYQDKENRVWIGTLRGGINIIDAKKNRFKTIRHDPLNKNSLVNDYVISFCEDVNRNIWIGTDDGGLSYWDRKKNSFINYQHEPGDRQSISNNSVTSIVSDHNNDIWVGTWNGGINRFNKQSRSFEKFPCINTITNQEDRNVLILYEDKEKTLWASTFISGGLYFFNAQKKMFESFDEKLTDLLTLAEDRNNNFWAGNHNMLIEIDRLQKKHRKYNIGSCVRAIHEDKAGHFWIGTEGRGLLLFDRIKGTFTAFSEKDGLCSNTVLTILEDEKGYLWLSTFNGISRFDPASRKFVNYSQSDGLQSNQFSCNAALALQSGELVFGGIRGLNVFFPDRIYNSTNIPLVFITGVKINNIPIEADNSYITKSSLFQIREIKLPFDKATLSLDFVALEYTSPDKISYAYYLEGRDDDWNYAGKNRTVNYTRLHEGKYIFKVKATDADGIWNGKEQTLTIIVLPPWYRSWWAYLLYFTTGVSLIYAYTKYKEQKTRLAYEIAWAKKETEKERELNEKKLSFFTNISHELRAPLTLIINPVRELLYHPEKLSQTNDLSIVYRNARRLLSLVDQLLLFRKADAESGKLKIAKLNFSALCREVYICFSHQAQTRNIDYEFMCDKPDIELYADREKMEIVLFNLLSNALKFTPDGGKVSFEIEESPDKIKLKISDSGYGIEENVGDKLFERFYQEKNKLTSSNPGFGIGLYLVKKFIEAHKGEISYESTKDKGTQFMLDLKKGIDHLHEQYIHEEVSETPVFLHELTGDNMPEEKAVTIHEDKLQLPEIVSDKKAVLLVDDDCEIREYLAQVFKDRFIIYEAENGEMGMQLALKYIPDIIISDVVMQGMTGVELCAGIKAAPALNHIPVILLTASSSSDIKLKGIECGADDYITKPFEKELLIARVDNILKSRNTLQQYFFDKITLQETSIKISEEYKDFLEKCIAVVEKNLGNDDFSIKLLAKEMNMSHSSLYKKVKATSGSSVSAFIRLIRLRRAAVFLLTSDTNINEVAYQVGISDPRYFRRQFVKLFGMPPTEYVKKYKSSFSKKFNVTEWTS